MQKELDFMIKPFEFYFDFSSPYTFLAHKQIRKIEKDNSIKIKYMPVLLGGLLKSAGIIANADIPIKAKYMIKDCKMWAEKYDVAFKFNNYFPIKTLNLMRCVLVAEKKNFEQNFINEIFDAIWQDGLNLNDNSIVEITDSGDEGPTLPTTQANCPKCDGREAFWCLLQTRGGDESTTQFYRCTKCKHTWRVYA